jgi:hypothetical protein
MAIPRECYDPETLDLMTRALDAAWGEVELALASNSLDSTGLRSVMSIRIMLAVRHGERDPGRLKEMALEAIAQIY